MEDGNQHHGRQEQKVEPDSKVTGPKHHSLMEASKYSQYLKGDGEFREERGWIIYDFSNVGDPGNFNGSLSGKIPLMCASSVVCTPHTDSAETEFDYEGQEACVIGPVESKFVDTSFCVESNEDKRC